MGDHMGAAPWCPECGPSCPLHGTNPASDRLDFDAIQKRAAWLDSGDGDADARTTLALVAEVRRLQARESRLRELPGQWYASTAHGLGYRREHWRGDDYAEGVDAGVEGCADVLRRTLAGE